MTWEIHPATGETLRLNGTTWEAYTPSSAVPGPPADTGTYGRFRYIPSRCIR